MLKFPHCRCRPTVLGAALLATTTAMPAAAGPTVGQFELKTLESAPGYMEFQSQNAWSFGQPNRQSALVDGAWVYDDNTVIRQREALEMELGFTRYLKMRIGIEFEQERIEDPPTPAQANDFAALRLEEIGTEVIAVLIPRDGDGFGLGTVVEVERPLEDGAQMSLFMGPILELAFGPWFVAAVPTLVHDFGGKAENGDDTDDKWDFAYAAQVSYTFSETWTLAVEAYGTVDRLGDSGRPGAAALTFGDHDQHRLGPVLYYAYDFGRSLRPDPRRDGDGEIETSELTIGVGFLAGLNRNTPDGTLKLSVEIDF